MSMSSSSSSQSYSFILFLLVLILHLLVAPFHKVEESFFMQAAHDIIFLDFDAGGLTDTDSAGLDDGEAQSVQFDHLEFPGVVPRSFIPLLMLAGPAKSIGYVIENLIPICPASLDAQGQRQEYSSPLIPQNNYLSLSSSFPYFCIDNLPFAQGNFISTDLFQVNLQSNNGDEPLRIADGLKPGSKVAYQYGVRIILAIYTALSLDTIATALDSSSFSIKDGKANGGRRKYYFVLLCLSQFHLMFYGSRTLANVFALIAFMFSTSLFIQILSYSSAAEDLDIKFLNLDYMIAILSATCIILRGEVFPLAVCMIFYCYFHLLSLSSSDPTKSSAQRKVYDIKRIIAVGVLASFVWVSLTILIDSYFWNRWVWPELQVFLFNGPQGKSIEWGSHPFHSYFTMHLPKIAGASLLICLAGFLFSISNSEKRDRLTPTPFIILSLLHAALLSFISHKEWRFIIYSIPLLNVAACLYLDRLFSSFSLPQSKSSKKKGKNPSSPWSNILWIAVLLLLLLSFSASLGMLYISHANYPGGVALSQFASLLQTKHLEADGQQKDCVVHVDVYTATTGASRFLQSPYCIYSKKEDLASPLDYLNFSYLITSTPEFHMNYAGKVGSTDDFGWKVEREIWAFDGIYVNHNLRGWKDDVVESLIGLWTAKDEEVSAAILSIFHSIGSLAGIKSKIVISILSKQI